MKSDSSRITFDQRKHFSSVRMQQGRVQVDADWNEQGDIATHRVETEASDVIGLCGGPLHYPAFHIVQDLSELTKEEQALLENQPLPDGFRIPDFLISAGRYYVDGILCENDHLTSYLQQPDLPDAVLIGKPGWYLIYVDTWQRLLTALDDPSIREIALGGPDTATRTKTVWQVKYVPLDSEKNANCLTKVQKYEDLIAPGSGTLSARSKREETSTDPCIVPPGAGYTGLENQLYRVEIHDPGTAFDVTSGGAGTLATRVANTSDQIKVSGSWTENQALEIFSTKAGADPMNGTLAHVTKVGTGKLTLDIDVSAIALDELRVRKVEATYKWSRDNGIVVTTIEEIKGQEITVHDLGPDDALGFMEGQWVELSDDGLELNGLQGQLAQISKIDRAINLITLDFAPRQLDTNRHPKLRRWDGVGAVKYHPNDKEDHFLELESGVQVRFFKGTFKTSDYWTIPARTATADTQSGTVEWPLDTSNQPLAQSPFGIKHHYCRLAMLHWDGGRFDVVQDCRNLFPPLTELTSLFYVSGDGQEVMPDPAQPAAFLPLPQQLIVGVANGEVPVPNAEVRFLVTTGNGRVLPVGAPGSFRQVDAKTLDVLTDQNGLARCTWQLDSPTQSQQLKASLQAVTDLNDDTDLPVHLPVIFTANLSVASQVAYFPGDCQPLQEDKTVQKALERLSHLISLYEVSGNNQEIVPGEPLQPLVVLAANRCGPVADQKFQVHFKVVSGAGKVNGLDEVDVLTDANGLATCVWAPGPNVPNQEVEATLVADSSHAVTEPTKVRFTSTLSLASHVFYDPSKCPGLSAEKVVNVQSAIDHLCEVRQGGSCDVTVGKGGQFERLEEAIKKLLDEKRTDICICLLPGDHVLTGGLTIELNGLHFKMVGCGRGSRVLFPQTPNGTPFKAVGLSSLTLRDLELVGGNFSIAIDRCEDVAFAGCYLTQENQVFSFIRIGHARRVQFENNVVRATLPITSNQTPIKVFANAAPDISGLYILTDSREFDEKLSDAVSSLAGMTAAKRKVFVEQLSKQFLTIQRPSTDEANSYINLAETLTAEAVDELLLRANLVDIRRAALDAIPGLALVLMDAESDARIENNDIAGIVSLYGEIGKAQLTADELKTIALRLKDGKLTFSRSWQNLHVLNNTISRMDVSAQTIEVLKGAASGAPNTTLDRVYGRCFLTNNVFGSQNKFVTQQVTLTANSFGTQVATSAFTSVQIPEDVGRVFASQAIYVSNVPALGTGTALTLFNLAPINQKVANTLNIVDS